jgi:hypothetical protein
MGSRSHGNAQFNLALREHQTRHNGGGHDEDKEPVERIRNTSQMNLGPRTEWKELLHAPKYFVNPSSKTDPIGQDER